MNLLPELTLLRALLVDFVENYKDALTALLDWHASFDPPSKVIVMSGDPKEILNAVTAIKNGIGGKPQQVPGIEHAEVDVSVPKYA
jgi:hypothetical protein